MSAWIHSDPNADDGYWRDHGMRECARADRCAEPRFETIDGRTHRLPALTPRPYCDGDRAVILNTIEDLPAKWRLVHDELGETTSSPSDPVSSSKTAPVPLSLNADELLRMALMLLVSWEERVRAVAHMRPLDSQTSRLRRDEVALDQACRVLADRVDVLLSLPPEPMMRIVSIPEAATMPAGTLGWVHHVAGYAEVMRLLDGTDAGAELLYLHWRCRAMLTDVSTSGKHLPVPCRCGFTELYEILDWNDQPDGAKCRECGREYTDNEFTILRGEAYMVAEVRKQKLPPVPRRAAEYAELSGRA
ncbi:hypothetical protein ACFYY8_31495 [Streptosporangium sp. NPDC001559]|uniref:hypothetical protein n=1 Tax=Streptosporangium sp. NPDC001559 TaxID=3366187 RepID=UPI0036E7D7E3